MEVTIRQVPATRVAGVRHVGPYHEIGEAFGRLQQYMQSGAVPQGPGLALYHDDPGSVPAGELRSDACVVVPEGFTSANPDIQVSEIPAGEYAVGRHVGSYEGLGQAWGWLCGEWLARSGRSFGAGTTFEIYVNQCGEVPAEELVTELYVPLAPA